MATIIPHLWFDKEAKEAAEFYVAAFGNGSEVTHVHTLHDTPTGDCDLVSFGLVGTEFMAISAGPLFKFNPSISFMLNFDTGKNPAARADLDALWEKLSAGGAPLMPLQEYPFSKRYGWIQDKYGLSWQLMLTDPEGGPERGFITPSLMFVGEKAGRAEQAIDLYLSVFHNSKQGTLHRYGPGREPDREGTIMFADFMLENQWFAAMDSSHAHDFDFNEAVSLLVSCQDQSEIDEYWNKLSAVPEAEQCGWLKDKFGVSWQITPAELHRMIRNGTPEQQARVTEAFLKMKKFDLAKLEAAYEAVPA